MSQVIFARPRHDYQSYTDFWRLVELSGYPLIYMDEMQLDNADTCYIFSTPATHWHDGVERRGFPDVKARVIYYNLEWYADVDYKSIPGVECWGTDKWYSDKHGMRYVPLGSHAGLKLPQNGVEELPKAYDLVMLSYMTYRRQFIADRFREKGLTLAPNGWTEQRHYALLQSRAMMHVHQNEETPTIAPQRWALAAAYSLPMMSEGVADGGLFTPSNTLFCDYGRLPDFARMWITGHDQETMLSDYGRALHQVLCEEHTFRKSIEAAL